MTSFYYHLLNKAPKKASQKEIYQNELLESTRRAGVERKPHHGTARAKESKPLTRKLLRHKRLHT
jgi:hypothetical protein